MQKLSYFQRDGNDSIVSKTSALIKYKASDSTGTMIFTKPASIKGFNLLNQTRYDDYGKKMNASQTSPLGTGVGDWSTRQYSGQVYDIETGNYYYGSRFYDASNGTWNKQDSYRGDMRTPLSRNRYSFVNENPVNKNDIYGFSAEEINNLNAQVDSKSQEIYNLSQAKPSYQKVVDIAQSVESQAWWKRHDSYWSAEGARVRYNVEKLIYYWDKNRINTRFNELQNAEHLHAVANSQYDKAYNNLQYWKNQLSTIDSRINQNFNDIASLRKQIADIQVRDAISSVVTPILGGLGKVGLTVVVNPAIEVQHLNDTVSNQISKGINKIFGGNSNYWDARQEQFDNDYNVNKYTLGLSYTAADDPAEVQKAATLSATIVATASCIGGTLGTGTIACVGAGAATIGNTVVNISDDGESKAKGEIVNSKVAVLKSFGMTEQNANIIAGATDMLTDTFTAAGVGNVLGLGSVFATTPGKLAGIVFGGTTAIQGAGTSAQIINSCIIQKSDCSSKDYYNLGSSIATTAIGIGVTYYSGKGLSVDSSVIDSGSQNTAKSYTKSSRATRLLPNEDAIGPHTTFKTDTITGKITHYVTWEPNSRNPLGFDPVLKYDGVGIGHTNSINKLSIPTPHVQGKSIPGGVRAANPSEIPN